MMFMFNWSDKNGSRSRSAWLLLVVAIIGHDYKKDGKWSHTTYRLTLAAGVRAIAGYDGWETGKFVVDRWVDVVNALGVNLAEAQRFLSEWRPKAAEALDIAEETLGSIAVESGGFDTVTVNFGGPTNRQIAAGFWQWPVVVTDNVGKEVGRVQPLFDGKWKTVGPVKILAHEHSSGYHGGYISMRLAVPSGAKAMHMHVATQNQ
jgi:hypothetical protein